MDARAVAGLAVRIHGAAVPDRLERVDPLFDDLARGLAVDGHHETDAAGRMFVLGPVQAVFGQPETFRLFGGDPGFVVGGHGVTPEIGAVRSPATWRFAAS